MARSYGTYVPSVPLALLHYGIISLCGHRGPASKGATLKVGQPSELQHSHLHACILETPISNVGAWTSAEGLP